MYRPQKHAENNKPKKTNLPERITSENLHHQRNVMQEETNIYAMLNINSNNLHN